MHLLIISDGDLFHVELFVASHDAILINYPEFHFLMMPMTLFCEFVVQFILFSYYYLLLALALLVLSSLINQMLTLLLVGNVRYRFSVLFILSCFMLAGHLRKITVILSFKLGRKLY